MCRRTGAFTGIEIKFGYMPTLIAGGTHAISLMTNSIRRDSNCAVDEFFNYFPEDDYLDAVAPDIPTI